MSYLVNKTDGTLLATVADTTRDTTSSDLTFIGKGFAGYGEFLNENFVKLLENFSYSSPPPRPIAGQLWYNTTNKKLAVNTANGFKYLSKIETGSSEPVGAVTGDLWYNEVSGKLNVYNGSSFVGVADNVELVDLSMTGNLSVDGTSTLTGTLNASTISASGSIISTAITADSITGNIQTASQPFITTVGTLTNLSVAGNVSAGGNISATGNVTATNIIGTIATAVQTNITSVGTLGNLNVTGNVSAGNLSTGGNLSVQGTMTGSKTNNVIPFYHADTSSFPSGTTYEGAVQYSKADDRMYYASTDGTWKALARNSDLGGLTFGNMAAQSSNAISVTGGSINGVTIGLSTAADAGFGNVTVTGNLTVIGTTTYLNTSTATLKDPVIVLGGSNNGGAAASDDNKDRGIEFRWHNGTSAKTGFFGYDDSAGTFTFIPDATNTSEVFSGTVGDVTFGNATLGNISATSLTATSTVSGNNVTTGNVTVSTKATISGNTVLTKGVSEGVTVVATAPSSTETYDLTTNTYFIHTADAANNFTANFTNLSSVCAVGESATVTVMVKNGSTPYYMSGVQLGGSGVSGIKWVDGTAPTAGLTNSYDVYTYTFIRTDVSTTVTIASFTSYY